jgi:hypothetical protein
VCVGDVSDRAPIHFCFIAAYALVVFEMTAIDAWPCAAQRERCQVVGLDPCPLAIFLPIAVRCL